MKRALMGAGYGLVLLFLSVIIAGAGHGILLFTAIAGAPFPPFGSVFGIPFVWAGLAFFAQSIRRWTFPTAIILHYIAVALYVAFRWNAEFDDPYRDVTEPLHYFAPYIAAFAVLYLAGHIWLWRNFVKFTYPATPSTLEP